MNNNMSMSNMGYNQGNNMNTNFSNYFMNNQRGSSLFYGAGKKNENFVGPVGNVTPVAPVVPVAPVGCLNSNSAFQPFGNPNQGMIGNSHNNNIMPQMNHMNMSFDQSGMSNLFFNGNMNNMNPNQINNLNTHTMNNMNSNNNQQLQQMLMHSIRNYYNSNMNQSTNNSTTSNPFNGFGSNLVPSSSSGPTGSILPNATSGSANNMDINLGNTLGSSLNNLPSAAPKNNNHNMFIK